MGFLEFMAGFDWITPTESIVRCAVGNWAPISVFGQFNGGKCQKILKNCGIKSKPGAIVNGGVVILVPKDLENEARDVLEEFVTLA